LSQVPFGMRNQACKATLITAVAESLEKHLAAYLKARF